jgi:transcriptional regulator of acetoin/glycerol metabolism
MAPSTAGVAAHLASDMADAAASGVPSDDTVLPSTLNLLQTHERQLLLQLIEQHRWNVSHVAKALHVSRNTLYRKLHKLHIDVSHPE